MCHTVILIPDALTGYRGAAPFGQEREARKSDKKNRMRNKKVVVSFSLVPAP